MTTPSHANTPSPPIAASLFEGWHLLAVRAAGISPHAFDTTLTQWTEATDTLTQGRLNCSGHVTHPISPASDLVALTERRLSPKQPDTEASCRELVSSHVHAATSLRATLYQVRALPLPAAVHVDTADAIPPSVSESEADLPAWPRAMWPEPAASTDVVWHKQQVPFHYPKLAAHTFVYVPAEHTPATLAALAPMVLQVARAVLPGHLQRRRQRALAAAGLPPDRPEDQNANSAVPFTHDEHGDAQHDSDASSNHDDEDDPVDADVDPSMNEHALSDASSPPPVSVSVSTRSSHSLSAPSKSQMGAMIKGLSVAEFTRARKEAMHSRASTSTLSSSAAEAPVGNGVHEESLQAAAVTLTSTIRKGMCDRSRLC
jgi:hypothetical protein